MKGRRASLRVASGSLFVRVLGHRGTVHISKGVLPQRSVYNSRVLFSSTCSSGGSPPTFVKFLVTSASSFGRLTFEVEGYKLRDTGYGC